MSASQGILLGIFAFSLVGCAGAVGSNRIEDKARRDVPIAICRRSLVPTDKNQHGVLYGETFWQTLFPTYQWGSGSLPTDAQDCAGLSTFRGHASSTASSIAVTSSQATWIPGEDGRFVVMLREASGSEHSTGGVLALGRIRPTEIDIYAIGGYRGNSKRVSFTLGRMGMAPAIVIRDDGCADAGAGTDCESLFNLYLAAGARLLPVVRTALERVQYVRVRDLGRIRWRLTTEPPVFTPTTVTVKEVVTGRDSRDDELRRIEGKRVFTLRGNRLISASESMWAQVAHWKDTAVPVTSK